MHHHDRYEIPEIIEIYYLKKNNIQNFTSRLYKYSLNKLAYFSKRLTGNDKFLINCV